MCGCSKDFIHGLAMPRSEVTGIEDIRRREEIWQFAWDTSKKIDRGCLPTMGQMIGEQTNMSGPSETDAEMLERYKNEL